MWEAFISIFINVLLFTYKVVGNFGVAIILFTLLIRLITHPLTVSQLRSSTSMQKLQSDKRWIEMQTKYKNDKEKLAQAQMELYKELGISPFSSCLPTLIQFPIIIGLYQAVIQALASTPIELFRLTKYVWGDFLNVGALIPLNSQFLWMDLSQPERLHLSFLPFGIPVLAILVTATTFFQSKLMAPPPAPGGEKDQAAMMTGMMNIYMPLLMGWLAWSLASGLALYFLASNLIGILQYALLGKLNWRNLLPKKQADVKKSNGNKNTTTTAPTATTKKNSKK